MGIFDEILERSVTDQTDREAIKALATKYPGLVKEVDEHGMRQSDYSRRLNEFTTKEKTFQATDQKVKEWETFFGEAGQQWDAEHGMTVGEWEARQQLAAAGTGASDMTFEQINEELKKHGYLRRDDLKPEFEAHSKTVGQQVNNVQAGMELVYTRLTPALFRFQSEFGRPMTHMEFEGLVRQAGQNVPKLVEKPEEIFDEFVKPMRAERELAEEKKARAEAEAKLKAIQEGGSAKSTTEQGGESRPMPFTQRQAMARAKGEEPVKHHVELGHGISAIAAEAYRKGDFPTGPAQE
jgi:hypothetical protein